MCNDGTETSVCENGIHKLRHLCNVTHHCWKQAVTRKPQQMLLHSPGEGMLLGISAGEKGHCASELLSSPIEVNNS